MSDFTIRPFRTLDDYRECVRFQEAVWGEGFSERVPVAILKVSCILGGVAAGAYDADGKLAGFIYGMTGPRSGRVVHWSDMLAVRPELRGSGLGWRLKAHQRECLLERGVETMYWTFDPLESPNAHLNLNKLGVRIQEYAVDMYGDSDSPLHRGIGTDRFVPRWEMASPEVERRMASSGALRISSAGLDSARALGLERAGALPAPGDPVFELEVPLVRIAIPRSIQEVKAASLEGAVRWRRATRSAFKHYLDRGYVVRGLERAGDTSDYLLFAPGIEPPVLEV